jgi:RNA polymerase sigma factor (sigma-70 family)
LAPQVLGVLVRRSGDFDAAEDAVQEALLAAALRWPRDGVPAKPRGWLVQTAVRRMIDQRRSEQSRRYRERLAQLQEASVGEVPDQDDTLILLFMCCHPSLTPASAIALTLRAVGGLTTTEIANAFLVGEATMAQRISRAKQRIKASSVPFRMPSREEQKARLRTVLHVLYLIFNEGYSSSTGRELHRRELSDEAIRLTRMLLRMLPDDGEVTGLLALMLLTDARRAARTGKSGELIPLAEQDRSLWNHEYITEGVELAVEAFDTPPLGEYQLQAAIAALHDEVDHAEETDWPQILALYGLLENLSGNPMV